MRSESNLTRRVLLGLTVAAFVATGAPSAAVASRGPIRAGADHFQTVPGGTWQIFNLPANFFGSGSDPVTGQKIFLQGVPTHASCGGRDMTNFDTVVNRPERARFHDSPTDTIAIQIVGLNLQSVAPLTVTSSGVTSFWDVRTDLSAASQPPGSMTISHPNHEGGTFSSVLPVLPKFTFTSGGATVVLDTGVAGLPATTFVSPPPSGTPSPWLHKDPPGIDTYNPDHTHFVPGATLDGPGGTGGLIPTDHIQSGFSPQAAHAVVAAECGP